jgi:hypothetical protein
MVLEQLQEEMVGHELCDLVTLHIAVLCLNFTIKCYLLRSVPFFTSVETIHNYNARSTANQSYYLPKARTNYGKFNIRFQGPKVWNSFGLDFKSVSYMKFKKN